VWCVQERLWLHRVELQQGRRQACHPVPMPGSKKENSGKESKREFLDGQRASVMEDEDKEFDD